MTTDALALESATLLEFWPRRPEESGDAPTIGFGVQIMLREGDVIDAAKITVGSRLPGDRDGSWADLESRAAVRLAEVLRSLAALSAEELLAAMRLDQAKPLMPTLSFP